MKTVLGDSMTIEYNEGSGIFYIHRPDKRKENTYGWQTVVKNCPDLIASAFADQMQWNYPRKEQFGDISRYCRFSFKQVKRDFDFFLKTIETLRFRNLA